MSDEQEKLGAFPYVIGGVSFIPGIGIIFGIIAIIWGLVTKKLGGKKLAIIGACGISFSIILYVSLSYFVDPSYQQIRTSPFPEHVLKARQEWGFGDFSVNVEETAVVMLPGKGPLFVIKIINSEITDENSRKKYARKIAFLAYQNKIYEQANSLKINNDPIKLLPIIGIAIIEKSGSGIVSKTQGHRYQFPFSELE